MKFFIKQLGYPFSSFSILFNRTSKPPQLGGNFPQLGGNFHQLGGNFHQEKSKSLFIKAFHDDLS